jgi:hypothetical protein
VRLQTIAAIVYAALALTFAFTYDRLGEEGVLFDAYFT